MRKNKKIERLGESVTTERGTYTIVEYNDCCNIVVERDDGERFKTSYDVFKHGSFKFKGSNRYKLLSDYGICYSMNTNEEILFDLEDYDKMKEYTWFVSNTIRKTKNGEYSYKIVFANKNGSKAGIIRLYNYLMDSKHIDHINGNTLDNRKNNLRVSMDKDGYDYNRLNTRTPSNNTSGHKGVHLRKDRNRWYAHVTYRGKTYSKNFKMDEYELACEWVDAKRKELHGEFANFS